MSAPKMVECGNATGAEAEAARKRLLDCGYAVQDAQLGIIHCNDQPGCEKFEWIENGFIQCFVDVDGRSARVMDYAPGQQLQPHKHDIHEYFEIRGGSVLVSKWSTSGAVESYTLKAGDLLEIPAGVPHALHCDPSAGLQFHELVGTGEEAFNKRSTEFLVTQGYNMAHPSCAVLNTGQGDLAATPKAPRSLRCTSRPALPYLGEQFGSLRGTDRD
ncbi:hypothetical protein CTAYLR_010264 [Chrysophaeum taylorii]|uniref:Cupin type-2 domain-containing protein n=1 Tax=Chrysophaeum taylorii TaxID=2483200 RepID=A0AAD7UJN9_9STRA|nr:hypothetical protein CTAYLR_010264 [Chrysophaeum taylorii]